MATVKTADLIQWQRRVSVVDIRPGHSLEVSLGLVLSPGLIPRLPGLGPLPRVPGSRVLSTRVSVNRALKYSSMTGHVMLPEVEVVMRILGVAHYVPAHHSYTLPPSGLHNS